MSQQPSSGYRRSVGGLVGALIIVLLAIAFVWALSRFQHRTPANPAPTVNYAQSLRAARSEAPFHVLAPTPPPAGWRCTSVDYQAGGRRVAWHLGFLTGDDQYVGLEQGNARMRRFVSAKTPATLPGRPVVIDGHRWRTLRSSSGKETALVREQRGVTTIVTGTAPLGDLEAFASRLA